MGLGLGLLFSGIINAITLLSSIFPVLCAAIVTRSVIKIRGSHAVSKYVPFLAKADFREQNREHRSVLFRIQRCLYDTFHFQPIRSNDLCDILEKSSCILACSVQSYLEKPEQVLNLYENALIAARSRYSGEQDSPRVTAVGLHAVARGVRTVR